ncbi:hypothetical protein [Streptomyces sp. NPDC059597]|uniref:hypothetical protein n=1 Tax=Streptomyces sp. NPDC059597 TaxID=3346879 RepID=UPI003697C8A6
MIFDVMNDHGRRCVFDPLFTGYANLPAADENITPGRVFPGSREIGTQLAEVHSSISVHGIAGQLGEDVDQPCGCLPGRVRVLS